MEHVQVLECLSKWRIQSVMITARNAKTLLAALIFLKLSTTLASACQFHGSQTLLDVRGAHIALIGRVVRYDFQPRNGQAVDSAIFTVEPTVPLRGIGLSRQLIYWENSTFRVPTEWRTDQMVFIAAKKIDSNFWELRGGIVDRADEPVPFELLQVPCEPAFIFNAFSVRAVFATSLILLNWIVALFAAGIIWRLLKIRRDRKLEG